MEEDTVSQQEMDFCWLYAQEPSDPLPAFRKAFGVEGQDEDAVRAQVDALYAREAVRLESYVQRRIACALANALAGWQASGTAARLLIEYDTIQRAACESGNLALAASITSAKAVLMGHIPPSDFHAVQAAFGQSTEERDPLTHESVQHQAAKLATETRH